MEKNEGVIIQSVIRALKILQCFRGNNEEMGISEISDCINLSKSTTYGLVNTLKATGFLEQNMNNKKYRLGIELFELGNLVQSRMDLRDEARPFCKKLSEKYNTTVHLAVFHEGDVIYVDKLINNDLQIVSSQVGMRTPMYCTGVGKGILAYLGDGYLEKYIFSRPLKKLTNNTITTREELVEELKNVREKGYAVDDEEIEMGLRCIAAPIFNNKDYPIAAISISASYRKIQDDMIDTTAKDVKYFAQKISERMGYNTN